MDAWTNFSETFDWLSGARSTKNSIKQVFRISMQIFCYNTDGWTQCLCCSHIITFQFRIAYTSKPTQRLYAFGLQNEKKMPQKFKRFQFVSIINFKARSFWHPKVSEKS